MRRLIVVDLSWVLENVSNVGLDGFQSIYLGLVPTYIIVSSKFANDLELDLQTRSLNVKTLGRYLHLAVHTMT